MATDADPDDLPQATAVPARRARFSAVWIIPVLAAVRVPTPDRVQSGVKRSIFGLVVFDALLASVFVGSWGLLLVLLLPPAILLGKWVYST